jgi:flavodoxin
MDRRIFLKAILAGSGLTLLSSQSYALKLFPNPGKQKWAILFGSRYGSTRDASLWIAEGMGWVTDIFDARENPDLTSYDGIIVGSGIYYSKIDQPLEAYLTKNAPTISGKVKALFAVCGSGGTPRAQAFLDALAGICKAKPSLQRSLPGRMTKKLLSKDDFKGLEESSKQRNRPFDDYDNLPRKDCLQFGEAILAVG